MNENDTELLKEIGVSEVIPKPQSQLNLLSKIMEILKRVHFPKESKHVKQKIQLLLDKNDINAAECLSCTLIANKTVDELTKLMIFAQIALAKRDYSSCNEFGLKILKEHGPNIKILGILGRSMLHSGKHEFALKCFKKADELAPRNIERLCLTAEANASLGKGQESQKNLAEAKKIAPGAAIIIESSVRCALALGDEKKVNELMQDEETAYRMVAFWNNQAVALTKSGQAGDGIKTYFLALKALPAKYENERLSISYNIGLAFARQNEAKKCVEHLSKLEPRKNSRLFHKVQSLRKKASESLRTGEAIQLTKDVLEEGVEEQEYPELEILALTLGVPVRPGKVGLYGVYSFGGDLTEEMKTLL